MRDIKKDILTVRGTFFGIAIITVGIGSAFSYMISIVEDAPGIVLVGTTVAFIAATLVFGIGEVIVQLKINGEILSDIRKKLYEKK